MNYDCWVQAGRPHWQCRVCMGIMVTIPIDDDFTCWSCKYGTERCNHWCHTGLNPFQHPRHCTACDGGRVITIFPLISKAACRAAMDKEKTLSKVCDLTADEIRKQWEDEVLRTHGDLPDWKLAVIYAWLHNRGMRTDDTEKIIREGLRKEIASK